MAWFRKKHDLISDRARALTDEIARLEAEIQKLGSQGQEDQSHPRLRSTALPNSATPGQPVSAGPQSTAGSGVGEPIFEEVGRAHLDARGEAPSTPEHYNELGVRKYDLPALMRRIRAHFRGPSTTNPKLVSYLAAGSIQGLRPLRYEKRVARNRFIVLVAVLFFVLLGIILWHYRHR